MDYSLRLFSFIGLFAALALLEVLQAQWHQDARRKSRWFSNFGLMLVGSLAIRAIFGLGLVEISMWAEQQTYGLFNLFSLNIYIEIVCVYLLLDLAVYWQHVASHKIPMFWRFHKVHHADTALDISSAVRFHPIEAIASFVFKGLMVLLIGAPAAAVLLFELALNLGACFNHANIRIPSAVDKAMRLILVTPRFHRIHHSPELRQTNSNYGFLISWWDYVFGTATKIKKSKESELVGLNDLGSHIDPANIKACFITIPLQK